MSLKEYRAKRDFTKSPEPSGNDETSAKRRDTAKRFFCVQKHLATALHYDFRLEHDGVLLSWAVPKGPSLDPAVKRLAMHVEDHPIEYGTFEGVIPEGYGAGVVMLWDQGTWTPETDDINASLAKGDLKFTLDGYKLKGSWVLVRTKGWGGGAKGGDSGGRSWLLIKHRDDWAGPIDITTFAPNSVKSSGSFRDILMQEAPDLWHSNRPAADKSSGEAAMMKIVEKVIALEEEQGAAAGAGTTAAGTSSKASAPGKKRAARSGDDDEEDAGAAKATPAASAESTSKRPAKRAKPASSSAAAKRDIPPRPARSAKKR